MAHTPVFGPDDLGIELFDTDAMLDLNDDELTAFIEQEDESDEETDIESDLQSILSRQIEAAINYRDDNVEQAQVDATDYYYGREFGNEEDGHSKVVSTDVRDAVLQVLPSLLRIFFGSDRTVEFEPSGPEDDAPAGQKTDYINHIVQEDNNGFIEFHAVFKDALVRRLGIMKYWWNEFHRVEERSFTRLSFAQLMLLLEDDDVEIDIPSMTDAGEVIDPITQEDERVYNVKAKRKIADGRVKIAAIPPEEFIFSGDARSRDDAMLIAHTRDVTVDELRAMDVDEDMIQTARGTTKGGHLRSENLERVRRLADEGESLVEDEDELPEETRPVLYTEAYMLFDGDGDEIAELRKFDCIGPKFLVIPDEDGLRLGQIVTRPPFALFTPDPEPHTLMGMGFWDLLKDVQKVKSQIQRATLDSLGQSVEPVQEVVAAMVNMGDLLAPELSGILRVRQPGMIREVKHQFVGGDTLPMLDYYDRISEKRSGQSSQIQGGGVDPNIMQSTTRAAVQATVTAAQSRIEMIARIFAETGMKQLFQGILELVVENQEKARTIRLRNVWVDVDPRSWNANMDVRVNVALGTGLVEEKITMLGIISQKQMELMQSGAPFVGNVEIRSTLAKISELAGWKNSADFYKPWGPEQEKQHQEALAKQPPQPDPAQLIAQAEQTKADGINAHNAANLEFERQKAFMEDDRARDKIARDSVLKELELELKYGQAIVDTELKGRIESDRLAQNEDLARLKLLADSERKPPSAPAGAPQQ